MVALAMAFQRCAIHSRTPPRMLCRAVPELCSCLTPLLNSGDLLNLNMLDMVIKDPVTLIPAKRASLSEEPVSVPTPSEPTTSEPEETAQSEDFALVPRRTPLGPPGFTLSWAGV